MNAHTQLSEREERAKALDDFGKGAPTAIVPVQPQVFAAPSDRTFGAVDVAVKRNEADILNRIKVLASAAGSDWYYRFPVKRKDGGNDFVEGASIKLANDIARMYGNCDIDVRTFDLGDSWVFYARFTDFETGYSLTRPFQQRKSQRSMKGDADRALDIAFQIGVSKAIRNVVTNALQTFADFAFEEAKGALVEKIGKNLAGWRSRALERLVEMKIDAGRVERTIGRAQADWTAPDIARIVAMIKSVQDGMATADETFPTTEAKAGEPEADKQGLDEFAGGKTEADAGAAAAQEQSETAGAKDAPASTETKSDPKPGKAEKTPAESPTPKNEAEYRVYAEAWIAGVTNGEAGLAHWKRDKDLRNKANVGEEAREDLKAKLDAKIAALKAV